MSVINSSTATLPSTTSPAASTATGSTVNSSMTTTTTNSTMPPMVTNSSLRHPLEQHSSSHPIPNSPGPMTLHLNDSSLPHPTPPSHSSSSLLPLLNSVPIINRLPSIDAASTAGLSNSGSIRSNNSSLRLGNSIYNKATSGAILPSPTLNHRIHGSRHRRTDLQQQIQLQLHQQQQHQQQLQLHQATINQPQAQSHLQLGRQGRHRHLSNCSSLTSSSDHSDLSCVTDDETANSCCNVNCFNCNSKSKHHQHNSNRSGHSRRHGHGLNSQQPSNHLHHQISHQESSLDEGQHLNCHQTTSSNPGDSSHHHLRHFATSDNAVSLTMTTDDEECPHGANGQLGHSRQVDYKSLGGCICCVPIFCCPNLCIANCNGQIITSYVLATVATVLVVAGVYCSLLYWDKSWLALSVLGVVVIIVGTIIHYTGSNSLARKLRRISNGPLASSSSPSAAAAGPGKKGHRQRLRQLRPMSEQVPIEFQHQMNQQMSQTLDSMDHSSGHQLPKTKQKMTHVNNSSANVNANCHISLNNASESTTSRVVSVSSAFEPSTSTSNVVYEELVNSNCGTFSNCDVNVSGTSEYQKVNRSSKRNKSTKQQQQQQQSTVIDNGKSSDSTFNLPLGPLDPLALNLVGRCIEDTDTLDHNRTNTMSTTVSNSQSSCRPPQIVNLNGQSYLILPIRNSSISGPGDAAPLDQESTSRGLPESQCHAPPGHGQFEDSSNDDDDSSNGEGDSDYDVDDEEENVIARNLHDEDDEEEEEEEGDEDEDDDDDEVNDDNSSNNCLLSPDIAHSLPCDATGLQLIPLNLLCPSNASTITRKQSVTDFLSKLDPSRLLSSQSYINNQEVLLGQANENASALDARVRTQALLAHQINLMKQQQQQREKEAKLLPPPPQDGESCLGKKVTQKQEKISSVDTGSNENESLIHSFTETHGEEVLLLHANLTISPDATSSIAGGGCGGGSGRGKKFIKKGDRTGGTGLTSTTDHLTSDSSRFRKKKGTKVKKSHKKVKLIGQVSQLDSLGSPDECQQTDQEELSLISLPSTSTHCNSITTSPSMAPSSTTEDIAIGTIEVTKFTSIGASTDSSTVSTPIASSSSMSSSYHESLTSSNSTNSAGLGDAMNHLVTSPTSISSTTASPSHIDVHVVTCSNSSNSTTTASVTRSTKVKNAPTIIDITNSSFDPLAQVNSPATQENLPSTFSHPKVNLPPSLESFTLQLGLNDIKMNHLSQLNPRQARNSVTLPLISNKLHCNGNNEPVFNVTNYPEQQLQLKEGDALKEQSHFRVSQHRHLSTSMSTPTTPTTSGPVAPLTSVKIAIKQPNCSQQTTQGTLAQAATHGNLASVTTATDVQTHGPSGRSDNNLCEDESDSGDSTASSSSFLFFIPPENAKSPRFKRKKSVRNKTFTLSKAPTATLTSESVEASAPPLVTCHGTSNILSTAPSSGPNSIWATAKSNNNISNNTSLTGTCFSTSVAIGNLDEISNLIDSQKQLSSVSISSENYSSGNNSNCNLKNVTSPSRGHHLHHQQQQSTSSTLVDGQFKFDADDGDNYQHHHQQHQLNKLNYSPSVPLATSCASQQLMVNSINNTYPSSSSASVVADAIHSNTNTSTITVLTNLNRTSKDLLASPLAACSKMKSKTLTSTTATATNATASTGNLISTDSVIESSNLNFYPSALVKIDSSSSEIGSSKRGDSSTTGKKESVERSTFNRLEGRMNEKLVHSPSNVNYMSLGYRSSDKKSIVETDSNVNFVNLGTTGCDAGGAIALGSNELKSTSIACDRVISGQEESAISTGDGLTNRHATRTIDRSQVLELIDASGRCGVTSAPGRMVTSSGASDASSNSPRGPSIKGSLYYDQKDILSTSSTTPATNPTSGANVISDGAMCARGKAVTSAVDATSSNLLQLRSTGDGSTLCTSLGKSNDQPSHHSTPMVHQASSSSLSHSPSAPVAGASSHSPYFPSLHPPQPPPSSSSSSSSFSLPTTAQAVASVFNTSKSMANVVTVDEVSNIRDSCNNHPLGGQVNETLASTNQASSTSFFIAFPSSQSTIQGTSLHQPSSKVMTERSASLATPGNEASGSCFISIATTDLSDWRTMAHTDHQNAASASKSFAIQISSPSKPPGHGVTRSDTFSKGSKKSHKKKQSIGSLEAPFSQVTMVTTSTSTTTTTTSTSTPDKSTGAVPRRVKRNVTQTLDSNLPQAIESATASVNLPAHELTTGATSGGKKSKSKSKIKPPIPVSSLATTSNAPTIASVNYTSNDGFAICNYYADNSRQASTSTASASASASALSNFYPHVYEELYFTSQNSVNNISNTIENDSPNCKKMINTNLKTTSNNEDGIDRGLYEGGLDNFNCNLLGDECTPTNITIQSPPPSYFDVIENSSQYQTLSQFELQTYLKSTTTPSPKIMAGSSTKNYFINCHNSSQSSHKSSSVKSGKAASKINKLTEANPVNTFNYPLSPFNDTAATYKAESSSSDPHPQVCTSVPPLLSSSSVAKSQQKSAATSSETATAASSIDTSSSMLSFLSPLSSSSCNSSSVNPTESTTAAANVTSKSSKGKKKSKLKK